MVRRPWLLSVVGVLACVAQASATAGDLDPTFGTGGIVTDPTVFTARDVVVLGDGRILVGGRTGGDPSAFVVARYTDDGALDPTFGTGGYAVTPIGAVDAYVEKLLVQPDGKIVAAGYSDLVTDDDPSIAVARYDADGALDATFGTGGVAIHNAAVESLAYDAALQDDGKIVLAGTALATDYNAFVGRLDADGSLDTGFGTGGWVLETGFVGGGSLFNAVLVKPDGSIVAAGTDSRFLPSRYLLVRYDAAGARDATFGTGGVVLTDVPGGGVASDLDFGPGDTLVATGRAGGFGKMGVVRYLSDGSPDPSFGSGGITTLSIPNQTTAYDAVVGADGRITVAAYRYVPGTFNDLVAARFLANGAADAAFGGAGWVAVDVGNNDFGNAIALQDDGKILVAGTTASETGMLLVRLLDGRCPPAATGGCKAPLQPFASSVKIKADADPTKRRLTWRWKKGAATTLADLGDPTATADYALCGYDASPTGAFLFEASVPPGDGWTAFGTAGFAYRDRTGASAGITAIKLKSGGAGAASLQVTARGPGFTPPAMPLSTPVVVQLRASTGSCFTATYDARVTRNDARRFVAKGD